MSSKMHKKSTVSGARHYRVKPELEALVVTEFLTALDCPRALTALILYRNMEFEQLVSLELDPLDFEDPLQFRDAYIATEFLSKYPDFPVTWDKEEVALRKFEDFELLCKQTNARFRHLQSDALYTGQTVWLHHAVTRKIASVLGEYRVEELCDNTDWGPGASTSIRRRNACPSEKFECETRVTRDLHALFPFLTLAGIYPAWAETLEKYKYPSFEVGNRVTTVPKTAKTDRVIAIEPGINLWFQKGIGEMIRKRLLRCAVVLRKQEINQYGAKWSSKTGLLCTIDLSSASDSIAVELVREILPPDWFAIMDAARSHFGKIRGKQVKWEKFSSMGNGFTFPLQSLIFYAIAQSCVEYHKLAGWPVCVYGDDIIIPTEAYETFHRMIEFYGFRINRKKTHFRSPFRESCGAHFYDGVNVKPIYLDDRLSGLLSVYRLANRILELSSHHAGTKYAWREGRFRAVHSRLVQSVPKNLRILIPSGVGDGGFISDFDEAVPVRARNGTEGYQFLHLTETGISRPDHRAGFLLASLWALENSDLSRTVARRHMFDFVEKSRAWGVIYDDTLRPDRVSRPNQATLKNSVRISAVISQVRQWMYLGQWID